MMDCSRHVDNQLMPGSTVSKNYYGQDDVLVSTAAPPVKMPRPIQKFRETCYCSHDESSSHRAIQKQGHECRCCEVSKSPSGPCGCEEVTQKLKLYYENSTPPFDHISISQKDYIPHKVPYREIPSWHPCNEVRSRYNALHANETTYQSSYLPPPQRIKETKKCIGLTKVEEAKPPCPALYRYRNFCKDQQDEWDIHRKSGEQILKQDIPETRSFLCSDQYERKAQLSQQESNQVQKITCHACGYPNNDQSLHRKPDESSSGNLLLCEHPDESSCLQPSNKFTLYENGKVPTTKPWWKNNSRYEKAVDTNDQRYDQLQHPFSAKTMYQKDFREPPPPPRAPPCWYPHMRERRSAPAEISPWKSCYKDHYQAPYLWKSGCINSSL